MAAPTVRDLFYDSTRDLFAQANPKASGVSLHPVPASYGAGGAVVASPGVRPVFITARFRSGSTFLWQLFRNVKDVTCYYEPLNERRWFLPESRSYQVDSTHLGVEDYWREYEGMEELDQWFNLEWPFRSLYMDATHHDPGLERYIQELIVRARGLAVLQFNRVDFRLPWLRAHFPDAVIVHLYRDPREQWMSVIGKSGYVTPDFRYQRGNLYEFDAFYTLIWAKDLRTVFPFLSPFGRHPYELHYLLWRLSYSYGRSFSDISIGFEDLVSDFDRVAMDLFQKLDIQQVDMDVLRTLNRGKIQSRWREYAPAEWFSQMESRCDRELDIFFSTKT